MLLHIDQYLGGRIFPIFPDLPARCNGTRGNDTRGKRRHLVIAEAISGRLHPVDQQPVAVHRYVVVPAAECISLRKRHRLTAMRPPYHRETRMSFLEKIARASGKLDARPADPWRKIIAEAVDDVDAMSSAALLNLVGARPSTGNARRLAAIMRDLKFIPIQSRRLMPGGSATRSPGVGTPYPIVSNS